MEGTTRRRKKPSAARPERFLAGPTRTRYFSVAMVAPTDTPRPSRRLVARGLCAGVVGGVLAGVFDHLLSAGNAARFLPQGTARLGLFLVLLYAGFGAAAGALAGLALRLL